MTSLLPLVTATRMMKSVFILLFAVNVKANYLSSAWLHGDLCQKFDGRRLYLEEGHRAHLYVAEAPGTKKDEQHFDFRRKSAAVPRNPNFNPSYQKERSIPQQYYNDDQRTPNQNIINLEDSSSQNEVTFGQNQAAFATPSKRVFDDHAGSFDARSRRVKRRIFSEGNNEITLDVPPNALENNHIFKVTNRNQQQPTRSKLHHNRRFSPRNIANDDKRLYIPKKVNQGSMFPIPSNANEDSKFGFPDNANEGSVFSVKIEPDVDTSRRARFYPQLDQAANEATKTQCAVNIHTCSNCHLVFSFTDIKHPLCTADGTCRCQAIRVREPPYITLEDVDICGNRNGVPFTYSSVTQRTILQFLPSNEHVQSFNVSVTAFKNRFVIGRDELPAVGYIMSPFFPQPYPNNYWVEYVFTGINHTSRVVFIFEDFLLAPWSYIEIDDSLRINPVILGGSMFRPPILISLGNKLSLRFLANGDSSRGFKLKYEFMDLADVPRPLPNTDCGGLVDTYGGIITMVNMTSYGRFSTVANYDCVWFIYPQQEYIYGKHLSVKIVDFENMAKGSSLEIREGLLSTGRLLEKITSESPITPTTNSRTHENIPQSHVSTQERNPRSSPTRGTEHVSLRDTGFYIRLQGIFTDKSKLAIVYSSFSYHGNCYLVTEFKCRNRRCIPKQLRCDGLDHCGDRSDETEACFNYKEHGTTDDLNWWYSHSPNYYFPVSNGIFGSERTSSFVMLFLFFLVFAAIIMLMGYVMKQTSKADRDRENSENRIRDRIASLNDGVEMYDAADDDPPLYEEPPGYEDVLNFILSGSNMKLVRRPGGMTAWVASEPKDRLHQWTLNQPGSQDTVDSLTYPADDVSISTATANDNSCPQTVMMQRSIRAARMRHASLDLADNMEVVIWDPSYNKSSTSMNMDENDSGSFSLKYNQNHPSTPPHLPSALKRTSIVMNSNSPESSGLSEFISVISETERAENVEDSFDEELPSGIEINNLPPGILVDVDEHNSKHTKSTDRRKVKHSTDVNRAERRINTKNKVTRKKSQIDRIVYNKASYDVMMQQILDRVNATEITNDDDIDTLLRIKAAREKFQRLSNARENYKTIAVISRVNRNDFVVRTSRTNSANSGSSSRKNTIVAGTVEMKKKMLEEGCSNIAPTCFCTGTGAEQTNSGDYCAMNPETTEEAANLMNHEEPRTDSPQVISVATSSPNETDI